MKISLKRERKLRIEYHDKSIELNHKTINITVVVELFNVPCLVI